MRPLTQRGVRPATHGRRSSLVTLARAPVLLAPVLLGVGVLVLRASPSAAQEVEPPSQRELALPDFAPEPVQTARPTLPPLSLPERTGPLRVASAPRRHVPGYRIVGNTVFSDAELLAVLEGLRGRDVSYEELREAARLLTLFYVQRGYVTSGATLERVRDDGTVEIRVTEGVLQDVRIEGLRYFRTEPVRARVMPAPGSIVELAGLERRVRALLDDPRIERLEAELIPGEQRGEAALHLRIRERSPFAIGLELTNDQSPALGPVRARVTLSHLNVTGNADVIEASYAQARGLDEMQLQYRLPLRPSGPWLGLRYGATRSENREEPFVPLDIGSRSASYALDLELPVYRGDRLSASIGLSAELRNSRSFLLGDGFAFSQGVEEDGSTRVRVLRFSQEATVRDSEQVMTFLSTFNLGSGAFGATTERVEPDGRFVSWLGRLRLAQRLPWWNAVAILRLDMQLSNDPLLPVEQFSVGGASSVRGYRRSELLRDTGAVGSLELRLPIWRRASGEPVVEVAPFYDFGSARNRRRPTPGMQSISSAGVGFLVRLGARARAELYLAEALRDAPRSSNDPALADRGVHFRIRTEF